MERVDLPVIGIIKRCYAGSEAYITPTLREVDQLRRPAAYHRTGLHPAEPSRGLTSRQLLAEVRKRYPPSAVHGGLLLAGGRTDGCRRRRRLRGHHAQRVYEGGTFQRKTRTSNWPVRSWPACRPLIAEGRIHTPGQARAMLELGALAVVVGGAITRPLAIARSFVRKWNVSGNCPKHPASERTVRAH